MIYALFSWCANLVSRSLHSKKKSEDSKIYLGIFGWSVDQAYGADKIVIATSAGWDELEDLTKWCKENGCRCFWDRVIWDRWMSKYSSNGIGGVDILFIETVDSEVATLSRLIWA